MFEKTCEKKVTKKVTVTFSKVTIYHGATECTEEHRAKRLHHYPPPRRQVVRRAVSIGWNEVFRVSARLCKVSEKDQ